MATWIKMRGKPMMAVFATLGSLGSLLTGTIAGYLHFAPDPHADQMARMEAIIRTATTDAHDASFTVGNHEGRLTRLEENQTKIVEKLGQLHGLRVETR